LKVLFEAGSSDEEEEMAAIYPRWDVDRVSESSHYYALDEGPGNTELFARCLGQADLGVGKVVVLESTPEVCIVFGAVVLEKAPADCRLLGGLYYLVESRRCADHEGVSPLERGQGAGWRASWSHAYDL
jgi:hypothetical protein